MIEVVKCTNTEFPNRPDIICSAIIGRTAAWYKNELKRNDIVFIEKNTTDDEEWLNKNYINHFPSILFFKDGKLKIAIPRIMAQAQIMEVIESL